MIKINPFKEPVIQSEAKNLVAPAEDLRAEDRLSRGLARLLWKTAGLGVLLLGISGCSADPAEKLEEYKERKIISKGVNVDFFPAADILFVIDDSGSMSKFQKSLAENTDAFIDTFFNVRFLDYHIGVTTTSYNSGTSVASGGRLRDDAGVTFISRSTPDAPEVFKDYVEVGIHGSGTEEVFSILEAFFSRQNTFYNLDFFRPEAALLIVIVTDAEDQSESKKYDVEKTIALIKNKKNNDLSKVSILGALITVEEVGCKSTETYPDKLLEFVKKMDGGLFSLCGKDYGTPMGRAARDIVKRASTIQLNQIPELSTLSLSYGSQVIPQQTQKGWTYLPDSNEIYISPEVILEEEAAGTAVKVDYEPVYK